MSDEFHTRMTLLGRLRNQHDETAWQEFVFFYEKYIRAILKRLGVPSQELEDQSQKVLLAPSRKRKTAPLQLEHPLQCPPLRPAQTRSERPVACPCRSWETQAPSPYQDQDRKRRC